MGVFGSKLQTSEDIIERLDTLDIMCMNKGIKAELIVLGGAGIQLLMEVNGRTFRPTRDVDVNILHATKMEEFQKLLSEVSIDLVGGVMELPPMEDFRTGNLYRVNVDFSAIDVYVPSPELLACTKIFSKREKDLVDLKESDLLNICDKTALLEMVQEYKENMLNPSDPDMNVHELVHILREKGI